MINVIIFDWKQTLYDPDRICLIDGAADVLDYLKSKKLDMFLVGKGNDDMKREVERLGAREYFEDIFFTDGEKQPKHFEQFTRNHTGASVLVIGDKLSSEIKVGNQIGAQTIQVKQGKFSANEPENKDQEPDYVVTNLAELKKMLVGFLQN
jgi:FMN phosphatase YigB (HAD superfamily)